MSQRNGGESIPLWGRTTFKVTFDELMNMRHWSGLYSWPRTSIKEQTYCKTWHNLPEWRNPWILHCNHSKKNTLVSWHRRFQPFNLEQKVWVIKKFWKNIRIQCPKIQQKQTFFFMGQNLCWPVLLVVVFYFLYWVGTGIELSVHSLCYGLDDPGFQSWTGQEIFLFSKMFRLTEAHPASYHWVTQLVPRSKVARVSCFITTHLHSLLRLRLSDSLNTLL